MKDLETLIKAQRNYFKTGQCQDLDFRLDALRTLKKAIFENEEELMTGLKKDLNKSNFESYSTEIGLVIEEINYSIKHLRSWAKPKRVGTNIINFKSKSYILKEALGNVLIISPWNYPVFLCLSPLVGAIAAGNTAILKPSSKSRQTSKALEKLISENFPEDYIALVNTSGASSDLLSYSFDHIFYTGGIEIGKKVMEAASRHLCPVTLELGGKSPCIVDRDVDLDLAARRIVFGKFTNAGQTCVAPDYLLVDKAIEKPFLEKLEENVDKMILADLDSYPKVINTQHFKRLLSYLESVDIVFGGQYSVDKNTIYPTLVLNPDPESRLMTEEIFGPILPVLSYENLDQAIDFVNSREKPLALYVFSKNKNFYRKVVTSISYGGGCVNDSLMHLTNPELPFGGVGQSGMGSYHGKKSFDCFSHEKSILVKSNLIDLPLRYPPYKSKLGLIKKILK